MESCVVPFGLPEIYILWKTGTNIRRFLQIEVNLYFNNNKQWCVKVIKQLMIVVYSYIPHWLLFVVRFRVFVWCGYSDSRSRFEARTNPVCNISIGEIIIIVIQVINNNNKLYYAPSNPGLMSFAANYNFCINWKHIKSHIRGPIC